MKILFFALLMLPLFSYAQVNRSVKQLAKENTNAYLSNIFKGRTYKLLSSGELKTFDTKKANIAWTLDLEVEATETLKVTDTSSKTIRHLYSFRFFLDRRLEVLKSDCYFDDAVKEDSKQ